MRNFLSITLSLILFSTNLAAQTYGTFDLWRSNDRSETWTPPLATDTIVGRASTDTLTNKSINAANNTITNITNSALSAAAGIDYSKLGSMTTGQVLLGNAGVATPTTLSGGATVGATGVVTLGNSAVITQLLTGYTSGAGTISSSDSVLQAIQKLNGNDDLKLGLTQTNDEVSAVVTTQLDVPLSQLTTTGTNKRIIETGNENILPNPGFEHQTYNTDWTCSLGSPTVETSIKFGKKSLKVSSIGAGVNCSNITTNNAANLKGLQGVARTYVNSTDSALQACAVADSADVNCVTVPVTTSDTPWKMIEIPYIMGGTNNGIRIKSATTTTQSIYVDKNLVGLSSPFQNVSSVSGNSSYTPTFTALSTPTSVDFSYKTIGDEVIFNGSFVCSATGSASEARISIPYTGVTFSSVNLQLSGTFARGGNAGAVANKGGFVYAESGKAYLVFSDASLIGSTNTDTFTKTNGSNVCVSSGDVIKVSARARIINSPTDSATKIYSSKCEDPRKCALKLESVVSTTSGATANQTYGTDYPWISSCTAANPTVCTFTAAAGFTETPNCSADSQGAAGVGFRVTTASSSTVTIESFNTTTGSPQASQVFLLTCDKKGADALSARTQFIAGSFAGIEKCANDYECLDEFSAVMSSAGAISNENVDWISGNCSVATTSNYTCTFQTFLKDGINPLTSNLTCSVLGIDVATEYITVSAGTNTTKWEFKTFNSAGSGVASPVMIKCSKGANDSKPKTAKTATSIGVPTVPGIVGISTGQRVDSFAVKYGTAAAASICSASPCSYLEQIGNVVSSVTRTGAGLYVMNLTKAYTALICSATATGSTNYLGAQMNAYTPGSFTQSFQAGYGPTNQDAFGSITCVGTY